MITRTVGLVNNSSLVRVLHSGQHSGDLSILDRLRRSHRNILDMLESRLER